MKKWIFPLLALILAQAACNLPRSAPAPQPTSDAAGALPAVMETATLLPTSALPETGLATYTPIPTNTTIPPTETPLPSPTITSTPDPSQLFVNLKLSKPVISGYCDTAKDTTLDVTATDPNVRGILVFVRLLGKTKGEKTEWNSGYAMTPLGGGNFTLKIKATTLPKYKEFTNAWVQFQLIATNADNVIMGRSQVYADSLSYSHACP